MVVDMNEVKGVLLNSLYLFNKKVLQADNEHDVLAEIPHLELCKTTENWTKKRKKLILMPRGTLKSSVVTIGYTIQQVCKNPNIRILIGSEVNSTAKVFLREIKDHFEGNERVRTLFGEHVRYKSRWTDDAITSAQRMKNIKEPTVFTTGTDQSRTGWHCFTPDTWINTKRGIVQIRELTLEDELLTHKGRYRKIKRLASRTTDCVRVKFSSFTGFPVTVSKDHPFLVEGKWKKASDIKQGDIVQRPAHNTSYEGEVPDDPELWWAIGWWIAEGSVSLNSGRKITHSLHAKELEYAEEILRIYQKYGDARGKARYPHTENGNSLQYDITGTPDILLHLFRKIYRGPFKKTIPISLYSAKRESKIAFLKGIWQGDGASYLNTRGQWEGNLSTISEEIALGVAQLIHEMGINCSVGKVRTSTFTCYRVYFKAGLLGLFSKEYKTRKRIGNYFSPDPRVSKVSSVEEVGKQEVVSISVEEDNTYCIPQAVSHNCDLAIVDDPVSATNISTKESREKTLNWYREITNNILEPGGHLIIIGCLTKDSKVLMGNGSWRRIVDVVPGEEVWSRKGKTLVKRRVLAMVPQGKAKTVVVKTGRQVIRATPNHPFLLKNGTWRKAGELKVGDAVSCVSTVPVETTKRDDKGEIMRKEQFWLFGFLYGDGWIIKSKKRIHGIAVATSVYEELNRKVLDACERWFGKRPIATKHGYARLDKASSARKLMYLGLNGTAKTKRLPDWLWSTRTSYKRAFLQGIIDADGSKPKRGYGYRIELCNKELIEDLYWLSLSCGVRPTSIFYRKRLCQAPNSPSPTVSETWSIGLCFVKRQRIGNGQMVWDRITSIEEGKEEYVYDLTVEDTENFIANGFVTHNTRWHFNDLYSHIMENESDEFDIITKQAMTDNAYVVLTSSAPIEKKEEIITEDKLLFPKRLTVRELWNKYRSSGSSMFNNQFMNRVIDSETADFRYTDLQWYDPKEDREKLGTLNVYMSIDPAISESIIADYTAIVCVGVNEVNDWYVLEYDNFRGKPNEIMDRIFSMYIRRRPRKIGIEVQSYQKALAYSLKNEMKARKVGFNLVELARDNTTTKEMRIRGTLQPIIEQRKFYLQQGMSELIEQLRTFPRSKHDDIIDAIADCGQLVGSYYGQKNRYAELTREQIDDRRDAKRVVYFRRSPITRY